MRRGSDYLSALRDGRVVFLHGKPVEDVTAHPGFAPAAEVIAALYEGLRDRPDLVVDDPDASYNAMWLAPLTPGDLLRRSMVHRYWAEGTFGLMGRTPDHVAALLTAFAARPDVFDRAGPGFGAHVTAFYREARRHDWHIAVALTPPQIDRSKPAHQQPEPFLYPGIVEERDDGIIVRGAQMIGTSAALADYVLLSAVALQPGDEDYAISVAMPVNTPGLRLYAREPYAGTVSSFDSPLASRFDESDSLIVLRDVFVPWEHVFVHRETQLVNAQFSETGAQVLANYQALVRFGVKMELASGLAIELSDAHGMSAIPPVQVQLGGDIAAFVAALDAIVVAAGARPVQRGQLLIPSPKYVAAGISLQRRWVVGLMTALRELAGGGFIAMPSAETLEADETADDIVRYFRSVTLSAGDRLALLKVMWDLVGSEFGGRQLQYEMFSAAAQHVADRQVFRAFDWDVGRAHVRRLLDDDAGAPDRPVR
jgi:4-hydroxyphenylacetate 3-monooxygenase